MITVLLLTLSCAPKPVLPEPSVPDLNPVAVEGVTHPGLRRLLSDHWDHTMRRAPVWATMLGDHRFDDALGDPSQAAVRADREARRAFLERALAIGVTGDPADDLTLALFEFGLQDEISTEVCEFALWTVSPRDNPFVDLSHVPEVHRLGDPSDAAALLARYRQMPAYVDAVIGNLREGVATGRVANAQTVALTIEQIDGELNRPTEEWELMAPGRGPWDFAWTDSAAFHDTLLALVDGEIRAAFGRYVAFLRDELLPVARPPEKVGLGSLPDGAACYEALVKSNTTLPLTANDLYTTGFEELESIHAEMQDVGERLFGTRDLAEIFARLRTDPSLGYDSADAVLADATAIVDEVRPLLPTVFGRLPGADVVVRPMPDHEAPYGPIAYYRQPVPDGSKPGEYIVNTSAPETRPRWQARSLAFHESIPGHHLQIAIAQELPAVPAFRKYGGYTVFVEGWGLYSERLADEMGLYPTDLDRMGMLSMDSWRAARLVVDTGIHDKGWTREQAVAFMLSNTPLAENNIANEVDRYISWPGQALAYKTGQLHIRKLRADAEATLGVRFDRPGFHDAVLGAGALPMPALDVRVAAWVGARRAG